MKKSVWFLLIVGIMLSLMSCTRVPPGYVGIKVNLLGDDRGEMQVYETGRYGVGMNTEWHKFPTFRQNYVWTKNPAEGSEKDESFSFPIEGMVVGVDIGIEYSLDPEKIPEIFTSYRKGVEELTDITIRNEVRDTFNEVAGEYTMDTLITGGMEDFMNTVAKSVKEYFEPQGIYIHSLSLVSAPRYPDSIVKAIEAKNEATQRAVQRENELRESIAEAEKKKAEAEGEASMMLTLAEAEAKANEIKTQSLTKEIIQMEWIKKWDGQLPSVSSDSSGLMLDIR